MKLSTFITDATPQIVGDWERFARTCIPAASAMDLEQRRDHLGQMLRAIALEMDSPQTKGEQCSKSKGTADANPANVSGAHSHGTERAQNGYTPGQMVAEFRALRASVLRRWADTQDTFGRDTTEDITRFNEAIDQALAESMATYAEEVERAKDLFLGVLGHDLRNPIGAIMMSAVVLMRAEGPDWPNAHTASRILGSCTRMDGIVRDLLDFTRTRLGSGIPVVLAEMNMEDVCRQTVDEIAAFHPESTVRFTAIGELRGQWDVGRIGQVLSNLVGNAYQHGREGTPIEVTATGKAEDVVLTVHNQGAAMDKAQSQSIFSPFRQLDPRNQKSAGHSVGLGLYIAQAIVLAHQGSIEVSSDETGTTFTVRLPRTAASSPDAICP